MRAAPTRRRRRRAVAASAVCLGHALVLMAVWQLRQTPPRSADDKDRSVLIRLLPERRERARPAAPAPTLPAPRPAVQPITPLDPERVSSTLVAVPATAAASASAGAAEVAGHAGVAAAPSGSGSAPLALKPSREVLLGSLGSNPAVTDPRSNTPKPTFEEKMAMGLDPGLCVKVERLPDGTLQRSMGRWRSGLTGAQATGLTTGGSAQGGGAGPGGPGGPSGASVLTVSTGGGGVKVCS